jgi:REP element-mobilizing transposase RayT
MAPANPARATVAARLLDEDPVELTDEARRCVDSSLREVCRVRAWELHALNVRTTHVHFVVTSSRTAEQAMTTCKAYATRGLRRDGLFGPEANVWSRHGSTRHLLSVAAVESAIDYVLNRQ